MNNIKSAFFRDDGFNEAVKYDNPIQEKWVHKQFVKMVGKGEDDFIIEEKPVLIEKVNIQKQIDEEAKTTDLKYLLKQLMLSGDESILQQRQGFYGDITEIQSVIEGRKQFVTPEQVKATLPQEIKALSVEQLAKMSDKEISEYIAKIRSKQKEVPAEPEKSVEKEG